MMTAYLLYNCSILSGLYYTEDILQLYCNYTATLQRILWEKHGKGKRKRCVITDCKRKGEPFDRLT